MPRGRAGKKNRRDPFTPTRTAKIRLTERDIGLLRLVDSHRVIDSRQLRLAMLGDNNERYFLDRLNDLADAEYLQRPPAQKRPWKKPRPLIYALGIQGRKVIDHVDRVERRGKRDWRLENKRLKLHTLEHDIAVTEAALALHLAAAAYEFAFNYWRERRYHTDGVLPTSVPIDARHGELRPLPLCPDGYIEALRYAGADVPNSGAASATHHWFVELDRGTEAEARITHKLLAYWNFIWTRLKDHDRGQHTWALLFVTTSDQRAHHIRRIAQQRVDPAGKGTHAFLLTTMDRCQIDTENPGRIFTEPLWFSSKRGYDNPRPLFLETCRRCYQSVDPSNEPHVVLNAVPTPLACAPASTLLPDHLPAETRPEYAHAGCPGLRDRAAWSP